jgi:hypothetical protein
VPTLYLVHIYPESVIVNDERVPKAQPSVKRELRFVGYCERVLLFRLPFEQVNHGGNRVGLKLLVFEF